MRYFRCIDPQSKAMLEAVEALGRGGAFECICAAAEAMDHGDDTLEVATVKNWASVKRDRAERILPFAQKILTETLEILQESSKNVRKISKNVEEISKNVEEISENVEEISENLVDFDASNPDGSTRDKKEIEEINKRKRESSAPAPVFSEQTEKAIAYLEKKRFRALVEKDALERCFDQFRPSGLPEHVLLSCFMDACDAAQKSDKETQSYLLAAWRGKLSDFKTSPSPVRTAAKPAAGADIMAAISAGQSVRLRAKNWIVFDASDLTPMPGKIPSVQHIPSGDLIAANMLELAPSEKASE